MACMMPGRLDETDLLQDPDDTIGAARLVGEEMNAGADGTADRRREPNRRRS